MQVQQYGGLFRSSKVIQRMIPDLLVLTFSEDVSESLIPS